MPHCFVHFCWSLSARRAWIEMIDYVIDYVNDARSLSARRAWIEMFSVLGLNWYIRVALRKESVDRNFDAMQIIVIVMRSLSARRAWIEIKYVVKDSDFAGGRSPQGERG